MGTVHSIPDGQINSAGQDTTGGRRHTCGG